MKKILVTALLLLLIGALFPWGCIGSVRVRLHFQDNTTIEGFTTIHGSDLPNFKVFDIKRADDFYKLTQGTNIMPLFSKGMLERYFTEEIFYVPEKISAVSNDKITNIDSLQNITSIEYLEWMGNRGCQLFGFVTMPDKDIEYMRNHKPISVTTRSYIDPYFSIKYITAGDSTPNHINQLIIDYSIHEIDKNDLEKNLNTEKEIDEYYGTLIGYLNDPITWTHFEAIHATEYFQYLYRHIYGDLKGTETFPDFRFQRNDLYHLYQDMIAGIPNIFTVMYSSD
jgi:hypothetical protein